MTRLAVTSCAPRSTPRWRYGVAGVTRRRWLFGCVVAPLLNPVFSSEAAQPGDWSSPATGAFDWRFYRFIRTESGVRIQELSAGHGPEAKEGNRVEIDYVLRRSNGYFIYSTVEGVSFQPRDIPIGAIDVDVGSPDVIPGLSDALIGMKAGGRRRVLIPPELGYRENPNRQPQPPGFAGKRQILNHANEAFLFEIELIKIRG